MKRGGKEVRESGSGEAFFPTSRLPFSLSFRLPVLLCHSERSEESSLCVKWLKGRRLGIICVKV